LTEAKVFATQSDNGKPKSAIFSHCFAKGKNALAIHFIVKVAGESTPDVARRRRRESTLIQLRFSKISSFPTANRQISVTICSLFLFELVRAKLLCKSQRTGGSRSTIFEDPCRPSYTWFVAAAARMWASFGDDDRRNGCAG
jgi:hypothetical protein